MKNSLRSGFIKILPIAAFMLFLYTTSSRAQTTTIFSSGFELADPAFTFSTNAAGQGSNMPFFGVSTVTPRTGLRSGRAEGGTGTTNRIYGSIITPQLTFEPGYTYTVNVYARVGNASEPVNLEIRRAGTPTHTAMTAGTVVLSTVSVNSTTYTLYSASFTTLSTVDQYIGFIVERTTNGGSINIDDVVITRTCIPSVSNAGSNITTCTTSVGLAANTPAPWETGTWSVVSGAGTFFNVNDPNTNVTNLAAGTNVFQWTVTNASCTPATSTVTVTRSVPPAITNQPVAQTVCEGSNASFTVVATGTNLTYQWQRNGVNVPGGTGATLNLNNVTAANAGNYSVTVSGSCPPSVTSTAVALTVVAPPVITNQPSDENLCSGETLNLNVTATGSGLNYQWRYNGAALANTGNISGVTTNTLTITNTTVAQSGTYDVVITNAACTITSSAAAVVITQGAEITLHPSGQVECEGNTANFTVSAIGSNLTYQWRKNGVNLTNGGNISGANTPTLSVSNLTGADIGNYDVIVDNAQCPADTSSSAGLIVQFAPVIQVHPLDEVGCPGGASTISVIVTGTGITYQWRKDGVNLTNGGNISGVNTANLVIDPTSAADTGSYDVIINGNCGGPFTSNSATLSLGTQVTPSVSITASDNPACDSITVFFYASPVNGGPIPSYQWYVNNVAQSVNNDTIGLLGLQTGDQIYVEMTSSADCPSPAMVASNTVTMTVNPLDSTCIPVIALLPQYCPFTQTNITDLVEAERVYDATAYQYRIENTALGFFAQPIRSMPNTCCPYLFGMNMVNGLRFNQTYDVAVRARVGGVWGSYGPTCQVTTPPFPQISLLPSSCNITIPSLSTLLFSEVVYNVSNYRYQITGPNGFSAIYVRGSGSNAFSLAWVPGIQYATTYDIRVEAFVNGDWGGYGPICQVTTPASIPTTQLSAGSCNITLTSMQQILSADPVPNATNYQYRITRPGYTAIYTRNSSSNLFSLGWINSIQFGETYNVEVAAMVGGVWASYGPVCTVTTPGTLPTTQLASGSCNVTLTNLNTLLFSNPVPNAQDYQYRVINTALGYNQIYQRGSGSNAFSMSWVPGITYNTTYTVEVRANVGGSWGNFGPMCDVTTPANIPTTQLSSQWCPGTLNALSDLMTTNPVPNATNYQYHIFNGSGFNTTVNRGSGSNLFSLSWVPGIQYGETYSIEVRAMVGGVWANFGPVCSVTTPPTPAIGTNPKISAQQIESVELLKNVTIYPNPATTEVNIRWMVETGGRTNISMYDMTGRLVMERNVNAISGENESTINVSDLEKGIYLIDLIMDNERKQQKLVVN